MYLKHAKSLVDSSSSYVLNMPLIWRFRFDHHRSHLLKAAACGPRSGRPAARLNERPEGIADAQDTGTREQRTRGQGPRAPDPLTRGPQRTMDQDPGTRGPGQSYEGPPGQEPTLEKTPKALLNNCTQKTEALSNAPPRVPAKQWATAPQKRSTSLQQLGSHANLLKARCRSFQQLATSSHDWPALAHEPLPRGTKRPHKHRVKILNFKSSP